MNSTSKSKVKAKFRRHSNLVVICALKPHFWIQIEEMKEGTVTCSLTFSDCVNPLTSTFVGSSGAH